VAVFNHDAAAGLVHEVGPEIEVALGTAAVQLHAVKPELHQSGDVALVTLGLALAVVLLVAAVVRADAVVQVPVEAVRSVEGKQRERARKE
jgi:hypothetical protein